MQKKMITKTEISFKDRVGLAIIKFGKLDYVAWHSEVSTSTIRRIMAGAPVKHDRVKKQINAFLEKNGL